MVPGGGGLPSLSPAYPAFSLFSFPLSPRPPSPVGKGGIKVIFMQGASPLASPALDRLRHLQSLPSRCQAGGLLSLLPAYPAFNLLFCPLSPRPPSPVGKGEIKVIFMQGAAPLASRA